MSWLNRFATKPTTPPEGAIGQRSIDGSYFGVAERDDWEKDESNPFLRADRYRIVNPEKVPEGCTLVDRNTAIDFIIEVEGGIPSSTMFRLLPE